MLLHTKNYELILLLLICTTLGVIIGLNIFNCLQYVKYMNYASGQVRSKILVIERVKSITDCYDQKLMFETVQYGTFWLLKNYIRGSVSENIGCAESITYTTNADYTFLDNLPKVVERWLGPVSLALFAPGDDFNSTMDSIQYLRNCLSQSELIRQYVTFHIYFPNNHIPSYVPKSDNVSHLWPYDCQKQLQLGMAPYQNVKHEVMYKTKKKLLYPINVGRNIARKSANTYFILASDLELHPTKGVIIQFLEMISNNASIILKNNTRNVFRVFPLPVFEIVKTASIPENKFELLNMLANRTAISFHLKLCKSCHTIPGYSKWLATRYNQTMEIVTVGKREGRFVYWEPFYISDNREPWFDERMTWEGQYNKRIQNYAMCLLNYEYHVLHPYFLVHAPGIKKLDTKDPRLKFVPTTKRLFDKTIKSEYRILYGKNEKCKL